jgi:branched-chain amino acid transport system substrate-binding protein
MQGATKIGVVGYPIGGAAATTKDVAVSSQKARLKVGYINANFPIGSTDVGPATLAMKSAGVDGFTAEVASNTSLAFMAALRQAGVDLKVAELPSGYGADLLQAGTGAVQQAQGVYFQLAYEPAEMNTPATRQFVSDLRAVGVAQDPTYAEYNAYASVGLLLKGLKASGSNATLPSLLTALSHVHSWDALGLWGGRTLDPNNRTSCASSNGNNCFWFTRLDGTTFKLVPGADPICGTIIPGVTISSSS